MGFLSGLFTGGWAAVANSVLTAIASLFNTAVKDIASSVQQGITATTTPHLRGSPWFGTLFHSVAGPAFVIAMIVLMCAVVESVLHGQPGEALKRAFVAPLLVAIAMMAATTVGGAAVGVVNSMSGAILSSALGGGHAGTDAITVLVTAAVSSVVVDPILGIAMAAIALIAVIALWVELAVRGVLIYLVFALVPLSLAGVFWSKTQSWTKRTIEIIVALLLSQLIIYTFLAIGVDALSALNAGWSAVPLALGALIMSAFGLPIALRIAPHTVASAEHFGKAIGHIKQAGTMAAGAATGGAGLAAGAGAAGAAGAGAAGAGGAAGAAGIGGVGATGGGVVEGAGMMGSSLGSSASSSLGSFGASSSASATGSSSAGTPPSTSPGPLKGASGAGTTDTQPHPTGTGQVAGGSSVSDLIPVGTSGPVDGATGATDTPIADPGAMPPLSSVEGPGSVPAQAGQGFSSMPPPPADEIAAATAKSNPLTRDRSLPGPVQAAVNPVLAARKHVGQAARTGVIAAAKTGHVPSGIAVAGTHLVKPPTKNPSAPAPGPAPVATPPGDVHLTTPPPPMPGGGGGGSGPPLPSLPHGSPPPPIGAAGSSPSSSPPQVPSPPPPPPPPPPPKTPPPNPLAALHAAFDAADHSPPPANTIPKEPEP